MRLNGFFFITPWMKSALRPGGSSLFHVAPEHEDEIKPGDKFLFKEHHTFTSQSPLREAVVQHPKGSTIFRYKTIPAETGWNANLSAKGLGRLQRRSQQPEVTWNRSSKTPLVTEVTNVAKIRNVTLVDLKKVED